ncbi:ABC transporter substrate-binding protein [Pedococcus sp. 5OH_020]|uniref:ABC transporter substrate-binding protein n=1 Tax=Pedococcus sp. 5OH_020 TaxID=2989814 RepID=UPI0022E9B8A2|nr:sugar ABC transporter substrate-binding protein [Pedococcus sp. 5OH_020]
MKFRKGALAVAPVLIATLAACSGASDAGSGSSGGDVKGTTINYWYWKDDTTDQTMNQLAAKFEAQTGIKVKIDDSVAQPKFYDKLVNAVAAGNAPDATQLDTNMMGKLINSHVLADLTSETKSWKGYDSVLPTMWPYVTDSKTKKIYAVPNKFLMFYAYYRKDIFAADGVTSFPKTQAEFLDTLKKLYKPKKNQYAFDFRGGPNGQDQWAAFLVAGGAKFLDDQGNVVFDSPEARKSNDIYLKTAQYAPPGAVNDGFAQIIANLQSGAASVIINHLGAAKTLDKALGNKVGVALIPSATGDPAQTTYMGTMNAEAVLGASKHKEAARQWVQFLASNDAQVAIAKSTNGYVPVTKEAAALPEFTQNPNIAISLEAAKHSVTSWPLLPGTTAATTKTWQPLFQGAVQGKNTGDQVITAVAESLKTGR